MPASRPLLIARVVTRLNVGGPTRHVAALMSGLDPARFKQVLFAGRAAVDEGEGLLSVPGERVDVPDLVRPPSPFRDIRAWRALRDAFRRMMPDVVHTHQGKAGALGRAAARSAGVPLIVHTHHGLVFEGYFGAAGRVGYRAVERALARRTDVLVAQAEEQAAALRRELGASAPRIAVIPPGVDTGSFARRSPPRAKSPNGPRLVVVPARLAPIKDPGLALDVLGALPPRFRMQIFGDGPLRSELLARIAADPASRGRASIEAPLADPRAAYEAADVVLLTSRNEGTPLSLIEAQAAGTPVVAPDVGATGSVVVPGGGLVVARSVAALAAAVEREAERTPGAEVAEHVRARFGVERLCRDVAALYEEEAAGRRL